MVSKTAKILVFFLVLGLITPSGVLAQENQWMITIFNNVSDIPEEPNPDIEFNGITIIFVRRYEFMPKNRIEPLDFKDEFKDVRRDEHITFKKYSDDLDEDIFFNSYLDRHPFMRFELEPVEVENWTVNNITLNGKIRVHVTIFKNGFCVISLVFPIVTEELKKEYNLTDDFLVANEPLKPDDVINITKFRTYPKYKRNISLKEGEMTLYDFWKSRKKYLEDAFFEDKKIKDRPSSAEYSIYSWNINKTLAEGNSTELVKKNPWEIYGILAIKPVGRRTLKPYIFSSFSEVFTSYESFQIFGKIGYFEHEPMDNRTIKQIDEYGYDPKNIRLAEVVFLQEYMLDSYNEFVTAKLEELREKKESEYPKEVKEIARFRKEISIALDEFYLIEDSLCYASYRDFVGYGKQKRNLDFMHEILRVRLEELSKISVDMNNVIMQENNAVLQASMMDIQNKMVVLTLLAITLTAVIFFGNMYREEIKTKLRLWEIRTKLRRLWERKAKK